MNTWTVGPDRQLQLEPFAIMGIVNATPDSFSDGGQWFDEDAAVAHALQLVSDGADIIDVGGESTRPGAVRVDVNEQIRRTVGVITRLRSRSDVLISIDTTRAPVATAALFAGANIINDVAAGLEDPQILQLAASRCCGLILMHRRLPPDQDRYSDQYILPPQYDDVTADVISFLSERIAAAVQAGVSPQQIVIDPGLGFGKTVDQNLQLIAETNRFLTLGRPVLSGASRKSFLGALTESTDPGDRDPESIAAAGMHWQTGARIFRVHDVDATRRSLTVFASGFTHPVETDPGAATIPIQ